MSTQADNLIIKLKVFGFTEDEALVYIELIKSKNNTALKLSNVLPISRTKIYRILSSLIKKGFVSEEIKDYGTKYRAESYEKLNLLIEESESKLEDLKSSTSLLFNELAKLQLMSNEESKILHYRGVEGLKQVTWNSTKVEGDFRIYEVNQLHYVVDNEFAEKCRREYGKNQNNQFYQLTNYTKIEGFTDVNKHIAQWQVRHIPKKDLEINFEIQIYNNIYCMFEYTNEDIFIVEVYNNKLAKMQKQLFDFVWKKAVPMKKLDTRGSASIN